MEENEKTNTVFPNFNNLKTKEKTAEEILQQLEENQQKTLQEINKKGQNYNWNNLLSSANIPYRYRPYTFDKFSNIPDNSDIKNNIIDAKEYTQNFQEYREKGKGLILLGSPGRMKTTIACAIGMELLRQNAEQNRVYFFNMSNILNIKLENIQESNIIIIDDLGIEYEKAKDSWTQSKLNIIITQCYEAMKPIIFTTNYEFRQLTQRYEPRVMDRIKNMTAKVLSTYGPSLRESVKLKDPKSKKQK